MKHDGAFFSVVFDIVSNVVACRSWSPNSVRLANVCGPNIDCSLRMLIASRGDMADFVQRMKQLEVSHNDYNLNKGCLKTELLTQRTQGLACEPHLA